VQRATPAMLRQYKLMENLIQLPISSPLIKLTNDLNFCKYLQMCTIVIEFNPYLPAAKEGGIEARRWWSVGEEGGVEVWRRRLVDEVANDGVGEVSKQCRHGARRRCWCQRDDRRGSSRGGEASARGAWLGFGSGERGDGFMCQAIQSRLQKLEARMQKVALLY
jgi:hypothetical protein